MLGRLGRWLRMLGFDTDYKLKEKDNALINLAEEENRILVKNLTLPKNVNVRCQDSFIR